MSTKTTNITTVINALAGAGITNPYSIAGILSVISKESGFIPQSEKDYSKTSNARIKEIFSKTADLTESEITALKADPVKFFNFVYGGRYGNAANEGFKYRGRGFNQLTFKDNYKTYGDILKLDLVNNPDLVNNADIAARVVAEYFKRQFTKSNVIVLNRYGAKNINDFNNTSNAVNAFYNANAGFGKDTSQTTTSGKTEALKKVSSIYKITTDYLSTPGGKVNAGLGILALLAGILLLTK